MIDEQVVREALGEGAGVFEASDGATERILAAARAMAAETRSFPPRPVIPHRARGRVVLVAAVAVVVAAGISLSVVASTGSPDNRRAAGSPSMAPRPHGAGAATAVPPVAGPSQAPTAPGSAPGAAAPTSGVAAPASGGAPSVPPLPPGSVGESTKVESKGTVDLTIGDGKVASVVAKLSDLATGDGGFVASTQAQVGPGGPGDTASGTVVLQVPQPSFATVLTQVQRLGHATSVTTAATDVTGQYVDLQARITALQASRQQYLTILAHATSIGDILAVQSQLDSLQSQIEQLQGQLGVLDGETTYGTLTVSLTEVGHGPVLPPHPGSGIATAWHAGIGGFVSGFEWLVRVAGTALLVVLSLLVVLLLGRWAWRATRRRML